MKNYERATVRRYRRPSGRNTVLISQVNTAVKIIASIQKGKGDVGRTMKSIGAKRLHLSEGQKEDVKEIIGEWVDADQKTLEEIEGFFPEK